MKAKIGVAMEYCGRVLENYGSVRKDCVKVYEIRAGERNKTRGNILSEHKEGASANKQKT
jgi:hypothetical protein